MIVIMVACRKNKSLESYPPLFPSIEKADVTAIGDSDIIYPPAWSMQVVDSSILLLGLLDEHWIQVYNRFSGQHMASHVRVGEGPEEMIAASKISFGIDARYLKTFDDQAQRIKLYDKKFSFVDNVIPYHSKAVRVTDALSLPGNRYLIQCWTENSLSNLAIVSDGKESDLYSITPVTDPEEKTTSDKERVLKSHYQRSRIAISPDASRLVCSTLFGVYLEIFDINGMTLTPKIVKRMYPYEINSRGNLSYVSEESMLGFTAIYATDRRIIGALLEHTDLMGPSDITVWDWDGNPLRRYKTDYQILAMSPSPDNSEEVYALGGTRDGDIRLLLFHCPDLLD